nr:proline-rich protein 15 [Pogona vitticeps]
MAESASAAAAPSSGPGAKSSSSSSGAWWKSLTTRKKTKEESGPAWQPAEPSEMLHAPPRPSDSPESQPMALGGGSRRNLKISRSGRFKEKRKVRTTLLAESPQKLFEGGGDGGGAAGRSPAPAHPGEERPCP